MEDEDGDGEEELSEVDSVGEPANRIPLLLCASALASSTLEPPRFTNAVAGEGTSSRSDSRFLNLSLLLLLS